MDTHKRYKKNGVPRRGVDARYLRCVGKRKYRNLGDAVREADRYMNINHALGRPYTAYPCPAHSNRGQMIFHCGHDSRLSGHSARDYASACKSRGLLRNEIESLKSVLARIAPVIGPDAGFNETGDLTQIESWRYTNHG